MYSGKKPSIVRSGIHPSLADLLWFVVVFFFPVVLTGGPRAGATVGGASSEHYFLAKFVMVSPPSGEEDMLDRKFKDKFHDMEQDEFSKRVDFLPKKEEEIKVCGSVKSCEVLSIEIEEKSGLFKYTAVTKLINPAPPDIHPPLHWTEDCTFDEQVVRDERGRERAILSECHIPMIQSFARQLFEHDQETHGGNR
jgi:hypothetical protein